MRVSLQIDGDASGAQEAASATSRAVTDLGKQTEAISQAIEEGFKKATGSFENLKGASQAAGAANDNNASAALGLAGKLSQVAAQAAGADSALAKGAAGAVNFAKGFGELVKSVGAFNIAGAVIGLATTAATTFYGVVNSGSKESEEHVQEHVRLMGILKGAYNAAGGDVIKFGQNVSAVTRFQAEVNLRRLQADVDRLSGAAVNRVTTIPSTGLSDLPLPSDTPGAIPQTPQLNPEFAAFADAFAKLKAGGNENIIAARNAVAAIGLAALESNPALSALADTFLKLTEAAGEKAGLAVEASDAKLGKFKEAAKATGSEIDRLIKSMERQAAATEAEAQTVGKSAGEAARLRAEFILTEAAQQSGADAAEKYADRIQKIATRAGEATQKLALANLQSSTAFDLSQLGRGGIEATVADRLRGAFGADNVDAQMNSATASAIRFNEQMRELKGTTLEVASGAFRDFRTELQNGAKAWDAFAKAGLNALTRIIDKLADKALDSFVSNLFGSFLGGTGTATGGLDASGISFAAAGGGTFGPGWGVVGEEGPEIIKVHGGGVTVFPHHVSRPYLPGFAEGGSLSPWGNVSRLPFGGQDNGAGGSSTQGLHVTFGVSMDDDGKLQAYVKDVATRTASDGLAGFVSSPAFVANVAEASKTAKTNLLL